MTLKQLYIPREGEKMRIAGFMSGSGTNMIRILEHGEMMQNKDGFSPYKVVVIFSDNLKSKAEEIGKKYKIPVKINDISEFYKARGLTSTRYKDSPQTRIEFDEATVGALKDFEIDVAAYAGYMLKATKHLVNAFFGVNVHPADLSIMADGKRKYTGDNAVRDAILAGEKQLRATTHVLEERVDYGRILMISPPIDVVLPEGFNANDKEQVKSVSNEHQNLLKEAGDWRIFPKTLEFLADGRYSQNDKGNIHFDGNPIPFGKKLDVI